MSDTAKETIKSAIGAGLVVFVITWLIFFL